jgi:hypothetical protein
VQQLQQDLPLTLCQRVQQQRQCLRDEPFTFGRDVQRLRASARHYA